VAHRTEGRPTASAISGPPGSRDGPDSIANNEMVKEVSVAPLVDGITRALPPRDPDRIVAEVE
jgi:hypothetical protein